MATKKKAEGKTKQEPWGEVLGEVKKLGGKIDRLETRFDGLEGRFDGLEDRFGGLETKVDKLGVRLGNVEDGLENLELVVNHISHEMKSSFDTVLLFLAKTDPADLQERVEKIEKKLEMS